MSLDATTCWRAPKVLLHDHLDGGVRAETVVALAVESGYADLPTTNPVALRDWFQDTADSGSLVGYLASFAHTVAVMQTKPALRRVARECVEDLAADRVVYAEVRFAPELHTEAGLSPAQVVAAVLSGFADGRRSAARAGHTIVVRALLTAMRTNDRSAEISKLAVALSGSGVAGFDIAGPELGYPPSQHLEAFDHLRRVGANVTIHAGEADGLNSIREAILECGAQRLGHGVRIVDDITPGSDGVMRLGPLAAHVRDRRIALEMCPTSNVQTGAVESTAAHPIGLLGPLGFRVTVNTDNRLMSNTTMSRELHLLSEAFGYGVPELRRLTINAMKSAFLPFDERVAIMRDVIDPGYRSLAAASVAADV